MLTVESSGPSANVVVLAGCLARPPVAIIVREKQMVIAGHEATTFIHDYKLVMMEIFWLLPAKPKVKNILEVLASARTKYLENRSLLDNALRALDKEAKSVSEDVVSAIQSLEVKQWIYLKDTRSHSIFIDSSAKIAYGVHGLTERIRNFIGDSGAVVETGIVRYLGRYVTDGVVSGVVWLGPNYMKEFSKVLADLRKAGRFHTSYAL